MRAAALRPSDDALVRGDAEDARAWAVPEDLALGDLDFLLCSERCAADFVYIETSSSASAMATIPVRPLGPLEAALSEALGLGAGRRSCPLLADPTARSLAGAVFDRSAAGRALYGISLLLLGNGTEVITGFAAWLGAIASLAAGRMASAGWT